MQCNLNIKGDVAVLFLSCFLEIKTDHRAVIIMVNKVKKVENKRNYVDIMTRTHDDIRTLVDEITGFAITSVSVLVGP